MYIHIIINLDLAFRKFKSHQLVIQKKIVRHARAARTGLHRGASQTLQIILTRRLTVVYLGHIQNFCISNKT